jgi:hypothetical protein
MNPLASVSASSKHATDAATIGTAFAAWLIDHTSLFTSIAALLTILWIAFRLVESGQRIYFNWRYGPNSQTGTGE